MIHLRGGYTLAFEPTGQDPHTALLILGTDSTRLALALTDDDLDRLILEATALRSSLLGEQ